jgi:hypothetical protein
MTNPIPTAMFHPLILTTILGSRISLIACAVAMVRLQREFDV